MGTFSHSMSVYCYFLLKALQKLIFTENTAWWTSRHYLYVLSKLNHKHQYVD